MKLKSLILTVLAITMLSFKSWAISHNFDLKSLGPVNAAALNISMKLEDCKKVWKDDGSSGKCIVKIRTPLSDEYSTGEHYNKEFKFDSNFGLGVYISLYATEYSISVKLYPTSEDEDYAHSHAPITFKRVSSAIQMTIDSMANEGKTKVYIHSAFLNN